MKIKKIVGIIFVIIISLNTCSVCQQTLLQKSIHTTLENYDATDTNKIRHLYLQASIGIFEYFSVGVGYQVSPNFYNFLKAF